MNGTKAILRNQKGKDVVSPDSCPVGTWEQRKDEEWELSLRTSLPEEGDKNWEFDKSILVDKKGKNSCFYN